VSKHKSGVAGIYNRITYAAEKRAALDLWGAICALRLPRPKVRTCEPKSAAAGRNNAPAATRRANQAPDPDAAALAVGQSHFVYSAGVVSSAHRVRMRRKGAGPLPAAWQSRQ
jgi:hypothetical protein